MGGGGVSYPATSSVMVAGAISATVPEYRDGSAVVCVLSSVEY